MAEMDLSTEFSWEIHVIICFTTFMEYGEVNFGNIWQRPTGVLNGVIIFEGKGQFGVKVGHTIVITGPFVAYLCGSA